MTSCSANNPSTSEISPTSPSITSPSENPTTKPSENPNPGEYDKKFNDLNPKATVKTIKEVNDIISRNKGDDTKNLYRLTGTVQYIGHSGYGSYELSDDTGTILVYGCTSKNTSVINTNGTFSYKESFTFPKKYIKPGDTVTIEGLACYYAYTSSYGVNQFRSYACNVKNNNRYDIIPESYSQPDTYNGNYYNNIDTSSTPIALRRSLHKLVYDTHTNYVSYNSLKGHYKHTDSVNGQIKDLYGGENVVGLNREHVWPQSCSDDLFGESGAGSDLHHVRATTGVHNSRRGAANFAPVFEGKMYTLDNVNGGTNKYNSGHQSGIYEPADSIKGDIARIIAYVFIHYSFQNIIPEEQADKQYCGGLSLIDVLGPDNNQDCFDLLRKWNACDPVSKIEIDRNNYTFNVQHNRNPFIDHPSYMDLAFAS